MTSTLTPSKLGNIQGLSFQSSRVISFTCPIAQWLARVEVFYEIRILIRSNVRTALFPSDHGEEQNIAQRTEFRERARVGQKTRAQFKRRQ
jgi:hypothetical protein